MNTSVPAPATIAALMNATKRYGAITAVDRLNLDIRRGEMLHSCTCPCNEP